MYKRWRIVLIILATVVLLALIVLVIVQSKDTEPTQPEVVPYGTVNSDSVSPAMLMPVDVDAPVDVVRRYFDCWAAKDTAGMDACLLPRDRGTVSYDELEYEAAVTLLSITERPAEEATGRFSADWYEQTPADIALVMTNYSIEYNEAGKALYLRDGLDRTDYQFWLIREKANSEWVIIMQGY